MSVEVSEIVVIAKKSTDGTPGYTTSYGGSAGTVFTGGGATYSNPAPSTTEHKAAVNIHVYDNNNLAAAEKSAAELAKALTDVFDALDKMPQNLVIENHGSKNDHCSD
jgi:hypothetical protein